MIAAGSVLSCPNFKSFWDSDYRNDNSGLLRQGCRAEQGIAGRDAGKGRICGTVTKLDFCPFVTHVILGNRGPQTFENPRKPQGVSKLCRIIAKSGGNRRLRDDPLGAREGLHHRSAIRSSPRHRDDSLGSPIGIASPPSQPIASMAFPAYPAGEA